MISVDHEDAILKTFILFIQTAREVLKYADAYLYRNMRLSIIKLIVLRALASNGGCMRPSELAEWTQTERHNITTLIVRMGQEGLIATARNINNRKNVDVTLTDKGREILSRAMPVAREVVDQVMLSIAKSDAALLDKALSVLRQNAGRGLKGLVKHSRPPTSGSDESTID